VLELTTFMNRGTQNDKVVFSSSGATSMCTVAPPGQSGFVAPDGTRSKHYDDQLSLYEDFGCKSEWLTGSEVDSHLESTKTLKY
jgi:penicillin amidase